MPVVGAVHRITNGHSSQIRRGDPIDLFIPSLRMRTFFKAWLVTADAGIMDPDVRLDMIIDKIAA